MPQTFQDPTVKVRNFLRIAGSVLLGVGLLVLFGLGGLGFKLMLGDGNFFGLLLIPISLLFGAPLCVAGRFLLALGFSDKIQTFGTFASFGTRPPGGGFGAARGEHAAKADPIFTRVQVLTEEPGSGLSGGMASPLGHAADDDVIDAEEITPRSNTPRGSTFGAGDEEILEAEPITGSSEPGTQRCPRCMSLNVQGVIRCKDCGQELG